MAWHCVLLGAAGAVAVGGCGAGLKSGVYRLDLGHMEQQMRARIGKMPDAVRAKMTRADMRITVDGDTARLLSNLGPGHRLGTGPTGPGKGQPTFHVTRVGDRFVLEAKVGPNLKCTPVGDASLDCTMPHGVLMRFTRAP